MEPFIYKSTSTNEELNQILDLQKLNLNTLASQEERQSEGFITVHHDFKILKAMNDRCAHTIAKSSYKESRHQPLRAFSSRFSPLWKG